MSSSSPGIVELLTLEPLEVNLFRGRSLDLGLPQLFGGHVLAQALTAASHNVVPERKVHSLHGYFLRPGDAKHPVVYEVDQTRDGGSFSTRRVTAIQHGKPIFFCSASYQIEEKKELKHQTPQLPEGLPTAEELIAQGHDTIVKRVPLIPLDIIRCEIDPEESRQAIWFRIRGDAPQDPVLHRQILAYASDLDLLATALVHHGKQPQKDVRLATIDHAIWFHKDLDLSQWHCYRMYSPWAGNARGLSRGEVFNQNGELVAETMQEGLTRPV
ncbi:Acyl-CoA thioesterase 2 [Halomonadaceae bacterium LMG 33818]|uniref:acyl-CoA thioesterase n=1 Tax=Cernens ardua TaxID=3402176 RepID=UPI003EDBCECE